MQQQEESSTRRKLLDLLKMNGDCTVAELASRLGLTAMAVRKHIQTLERDGLVQSYQVRQAMGRPLRRYVLHDRADDLFPKNYPQLALELLNELEDRSGGATMIESLFQGRRDKLAQRHGARMARLTALAGRVAELGAIQSAAGYMTEWEADGEGGYRLYEYNCPIAQIARQHRQACECEQQLFEQLLGAEVERTECLADGQRRCTYAIKPK